MKKLCTVFIILFLAVIALPTVWVFVTPDTEFSDNENRMLQTRPELSGGTLLTGSFQDKLTSFISDQFPARDLWTESVTRIKKLVGFRDVGGAYLGADGYYLEKLTPDDIDTEKLTANLGFVRDFAEKNSDRACTVMLVPEAASVYPERLPRGAVGYDYAALYNTAAQALDNCRVPDVFTPLAADRSAYNYYMTDHHWTTMGARLAYDVLTEGSGAYSGELELFSDGFLGTTYSKTLDPAAKPDSVYIAPVADGIAVTADGKDVSLYYREAANEKDRYKVFFGGNYAQALIKTPADNDRCLLVIKDSFANSLVPFLTADYGTIVMLDLRYFNGSVQNVADELGADEVLFIYEASSFANENNLIKLSF